MVDLGWILGGEATTLDRVSRIEVREGIMKAPEVVVSQYCLFCWHDVVSVRVLSWDKLEYIPLHH